MRIGIVLPQVSAYSETFFDNKIRGLHAQGHKVVLFINSNHHDEVIQDIPLRVAPKLSGSFIIVLLKSIFLFIRICFKSFKKSIKLYNLNRINHVSIIQSIKNVLSSSYILEEPLDWLHFGFGTMVINKEYVAQAMGAKMAISFRGFDIGVYPIKNPGCYSKAWAVVDKVHVISDDIKNLVYQNGFNDEAPIVKITPAIDTSFFLTDLKEQGLSSPLNFITIARLHWKKGLVYTMEALSYFKRTNPNFKYTIIGEGMDIERLKFATYQLGIQENVVFAGRCSREDIKSKLIEADIYIQYSVQEGFCNSVLEAQALGLACIVSDAEGLSENVINEETGWVVKSRDSKKLSDTLIKIINLPNNEMLKIKKNAVHRVRKEFNLIIQDKRFREFYKT